MGMHRADVSPFICLVRAAPGCISTIRPSDKVRCLGFDWSEISAPADAKRNRARPCL